MAGRLERLLNLVLDAILDHPILGILNIIFAVLLVLWLLDFFEFLRGG